MLNLTESVYWIETEEGSNTGNCFFKDGIFRRVGEHWKEEPCVNCTCQENGQVSCQAIMCKFCANAIPPDPGECCSHCPQPTSSTDVDVDNKSICKTPLIDCNLNCDRYLTDEDGCQICECYESTKVSLSPIFFFFFCYFRRTFLLFYYISSF